MSKDPSIPRSNKVNWHYVRDDHMFTTIKLVSRHHNTQQFGAMLPIELTNADIKNSNAYKEYYAVATGATPTKPKASVRKTKSSSDTTVTPLTATAQQLKLATKRSLQQTHISQASGSGADEGTGNDDEGKDGDGDDEDEGDYEEGDQEEGGDDDQASDEEEFIHPNLSTHAEEETKDGEIFDPIPKTPKDTDYEGNGEENLGINVTPPFWVSGARFWIKMENEHELSYETLTRVYLGSYEHYKGVGAEVKLLEPGFELQGSKMVEMDFFNDPRIIREQRIAAYKGYRGGGVVQIGMKTLWEEGHDEDELYRDVNINQGRALSTLLQDLPNFGSLFGFDNLLKTLEWMNEAVKVAVQIQSDRLRDEAQKENDEFLKTIDENMQKIIKEQVKEQVKTSYDVAADLSEMELKKILIEKMEGNKSIHRSNEQRNLYKALVEAYESDKIILDTYRDTVTLKRRRDDDVDKDEEPSIGSDRGSKGRREGKEPDSASAPKEEATRSARKSTQGSKS
nr:hypothetical protein [Tanacetum cinerariifolium]